ncbi:hypothetical protein ACHAXT_004799 [Thalassiosira profunda]
MSRLSERSKALATARSTYNRAKAWLAIDLLDSDSDDGDSGSDDSVDSDVPAPLLAFLLARNAYNSILGCRYVAKRTCRKSQLKIFENDLHVEPDGMQWMNARDFKKKYRMSRDTLDIITEMIEGHDVFKRGKAGPSQLPVKHQLMVFLEFVGGEGKSNDTQRSTFQISGGVCEKSRKRVVKALVSMRDQYIVWPDEQERKEIAARLEKAFTFPHCVGLMDGTLVELAITPQCDDSADYHGRKYGYSLTIGIINDDKRKIRARLSGFPGSTHDNRVWRNMDQYQQPEKFFGPTEYLLCDTAFNPSNHCVPAYKQLRGYLMDEEEEHFNTALGPPRVITEHTMGIWKGRFPWLRKIRMVITNKKKSLRRILMYIDATIVLHNILMELGDEPGEDWDCDADMSDIDDEDRIPEEKVLDLPVPPGAEKDTRREQLKNLMREKFVRKHNYRTRDKYLM